MISPSPRQRRRHPGRRPWRSLDAAVTSGREMRVALVLGRNGTGGSESQAKLLVGGLIAEGAQVDVILIEGTDGTDGYGRAPVHVLMPTRRPGIRGLIDMARALFELRRRLDGRDYDVAHAVMARAYVLAPLSTLGRRRRPRIIAWRRNEGIHLRDRSLNAGIEWIASRATDQIVCNSLSVQNYWIKRGHVAPRKSCVIPNALEEWRFERSGCQEISHASGRIIAVGGLKPVKGHTWLVKAIGLLPAKKRPQIVIVGEGECRDELARVAAESQVDLILTGHVADPRPWLESSDVFVQASRSEGLSNALLEAMAQGIAVIATDVGGTREAVGDTGVLMEYGNTPQLLGAVMEVLGDSVLRGSLEGAARKRARTNYRVGTTVEKHLRVYRMTADA